MNLDQIGLKKRTLTALRKHGWVTVGDVVNAAISNVGNHGFQGHFSFTAGLLRYPGIGKAMLEEFENCIGLYSRWRFESRLLAEGYSIIPPYRGA